MPDDRDYVFRFTPAGVGPPLAIRVRRLLKVALRAYGLRAEPVLVGSSGGHGSNPARATRIR